MCVIFKDIKKIQKELNQHMGLNFRKQSEKEAHKHQNINLDEDSEDENDILKHLSLHFKS